MKHQTIQTSLLYVNEYDDHAVLTYTSCGCGCNNYGDVFSFHSNLLDESNDTLVFSMENPEDFDPLETGRVFTENLDDTFELVEIINEII